MKATETDMGALPLLTAGRSDRAASSAMPATSSRTTASATTFSTAAWNAGAAASTIAAASARTSRCDALWLSSAWKGMRSPWASWSHAETDRAESPARSFASSSARRALLQARHFEL